MSGAVAADDDAGGRDAGESLKDALQQTLEEARMVLPGVQTLFGFQLIAVFSERFDLVLGTRQQLLHLGAIVLVTVAIALVMTPAAYHRQVEPRHASARFLALASRLVSAAMLPLAAGLAIDVYLIAGVITDAHARLEGARPRTCSAMFVALWFAFPQWPREASSAAPRPR